MPSTGPSIGLDSEILTLFIIVDAFWLFELLFKILTYSPNPSASKLIKLNASTSPIKSTTCFGLKSAANTIFSSWTMFFKISGNSEYVFSVSPYRLMYSVGFAFTTPKNLVVCSMRIFGASHWIIIFLGLQ